MNSKTKKITATKTKTAKGGKRHKEDRWIPAMCEFQCTEGPCLCRVHVVDGVAVGMEPNRELKDYATLSRDQGRLCPKAYGLIQKLYNPHRINGPLKRTNLQKGPGIDPKWVDISWEEALDIIADKLKEAKKKGTERVAQGGPGLTAMQSSDAWTAFFMAYGPTQHLRGGLSGRCREVDHSFGNRVHGAMVCHPDLDYCNYSIYFGSNPQASGGTVISVLFAQAKERGLKSVVIDPVLTNSAAKANEWVPIKPGTDGAFMLAMINVILHELNTYDAPFLKQMTNSPYLVKPDGFFMRDKTSNKVLIWDLVAQKAKSYDDKTLKDPALEGIFTVNGIKCKPSFQVLKEHVKKYTPEWASSITDVPVSTIRRITKEYVDNACIGSTISLDGITFPYRPVSIEMGRGISGAMGSYKPFLSLHILVALVGAMEVPGGHCAGQTEYRKDTEDFVFHWDPVNAGIVPGPDGMTDVHAHEFTWPPRTYDASEILCPFSDEYPYEGPPYNEKAANIFYRSDHMCWKNIADPPSGLPLPPTPDIWFRYRINPLLGLGNQDDIIKALKKIPYIISVSYVMDEISDYADILIPEQVELEKYIAYNRMKSAGEKYYFEIAIQQPVIETLHNTMNINDVFTELAVRLDLLDKYNASLNSFLDLDAPYTLKPEKKYDWEEVCDIQLKSYTKGKYGLEWFKKHGALLRPVPVKEQYGYHLEMVKQKRRYPVPYMEYVKKTGEELTQKLSKVGINWWSTKDYVPLPDYKTPEIESVPAQYNFYAVTSNSMPYSLGNNVCLPIINEIGEHLRGNTSIFMNAQAAADMGIKEGDQIFVESIAGKLKGAVSLGEGIRPDSILIANQFGQWAMPVAKDKGWVTLNTLLPNDYKWTDRVLGNQQGHVFKVKIEKAK
ncbi:MAG: molybdopterin-dependent oxidoreductase [Smithella sp.]|nr:molybdopterin-dependent oxidoreductase [Smithella sp.]